MSSTTPLNRAVGSTVQPVAVTVVMSASSVAPSVTLMPRLTLVGAAANGADQTTATESSAPVNVAVVVAMAIYRQPSNGAERGHFWRITRSIEMLNVRPFDAVAAPGSTRDNPGMGEAVASMMKRCAYCAEEILVDAIKCRHCGSSIVVEPTCPCGGKILRINYRKRSDGVTFWAWAFIICGIIGLPLLGLGAIGIIAGIVMLLTIKNEERLRIECMQCKRMADHRLG